MHKAPAQSERELMRDIQLALSDVRDLRLWRANVGRGWISEAAPLRTMVQGIVTITLTNARPFDTGLPEGFPDLFGFIGSPSLVPVPVFIEVKSAVGRVSPKQQKFIDAARAAGCLAGVARSVEDALRIVRGRP